MIEHKKGDLLAVTEGVIIHGCNCKGVMGSGVAKAIRDKYPKAYDAYKNFQNERGLRLASVSIYTRGGLTIANLVTQENYGRDPKAQYVSYGAVHLGFEKLHKYFTLDVPFHFPMIGTGLGNGNWVTISSLIDLACPGREMICWQL